MSAVPGAAIIPAQRGTPARFRLGYRPCLDGLRGIAILAVVIAHTEKFPTRAGFVGVDLFFVLSGFLITRLLLEEWDEFGSLRLPRFYCRRALRLLPALALMLFTMVVYHWLASPAPTARAVSVDALIAFFYSANWTLAFGFHQPNLFGHCWSLSIEEQFYLLWPWLLLLLLRRCRSRSSMLNYVLLGSAVSILDRMLLTANGENYYRLFYGTDTRAISLLLGCATGIGLTTDGASSGSGQKQPGKAEHFRSLVQSARTVGASLSFIGIVFAAVYIDFNWTFQVQFVDVLVPLGAALLVAEAITNRGGFWERLLSQSWLVYIGKISYGLYLWHYPIFTEIQKHHWPPGKELGFEFALTAVAVLASYYFLERPLLALKDKLAGRGRN